MASSDTDMASPGDPTLAEAQSPSKPVFKPTREFLLAFVALDVIMIAVAFDATTLSVALPIMSTELRGTALEAFWSGTSFLLASTVFQPTFASLSSIFGRKLMLFVCMAFFCAGSIVAALANSFSVVIAGRTIKGVGGGGLIAVIEVIVVDLVPLSVRSLWISLIAAMWALGTVAGPLIGAGFAQNISWRWIFWINLPIIGLASVLVFFFLNQTRIPGGVVHKLGRFDWVGAVLFTAGSTSVLFGITTGGIMYSWSSFRTLLPLILGVVILVVFAYWEVRYAKEPMIDRGLFHNWTLIASYVMTVLHGIILWSIVYFLTLYYQAAKSFTPIMSAVAGFPETLTVVPASIVVGALSSITGRYRWALWSGWLLTTVGAGLLCLLAPDTPARHWIPLNIPIGIGTGMLFPSMALSIQAACAPALNAPATAFFSFLRTFGQSVGVAVAGVIFQNAFRSELLDIPALRDQAEAYSRDATMVVKIINDMETGPVKSALVEAYANALRMVWYSMIAFAGVGVVFSATVKSYTLNQEHVTQQALIQGERRPKEASGDGADISLDTLQDRPSTREK